MGLRQAYRTRPEAEIADYRRFSRPVRRVLWLGLHIRPKPKSSAFSSRSPGAMTAGLPSRPWLDETVAEGESRKLAAEHSEKLRSLVQGTVWDVDSLGPCIRWPWAGRWSQTSNSARSHRPFREHIERSATVSAILTRASATAKAIKRQSSNVVFIPAEARGRSNLGCCAPRVKRPQYGQARHPGMRPVGTVAAPPDCLVSLVRGCRNPLTGGDR